MKRTHIVAGLAAGLTAGAGAGFALTQGGTAGATSTADAIVTVSTDDTTSGSTDTTVPDSTGTDATDDSTDAASTDADSRVRDALAPLVDNGTITEAQLDAVVEALDGAFPGGHGRGGRGGGMHLDAAATALGLDEDELRTQLADGSTLADVAAAHGVDVQVVIDAIVAESEAHLAEEVTEGDITQAEADTVLAELTDRVTTMVNEGWTAGPMAGGMNGHGHGPMGGDRDGDDDQVTADTSA